MEDARITVKTSSHTDLTRLPRHRRFIARSPRSSCYVIPTHPPAWSSSSTFQINRAREARKTPASSMAHDNEKPEDKVPKFSSFHPRKKEENVDESTQFEAKEPFSRHERHIHRRKRKNREHERNSDDQPESQRDDVPHLFVIDRRGDVPSAKFGPSRHGVPKYASCDGTSRATTYRCTSARETRASKSEPTTSIWQRTKRKNRHFQLKKTRPARWGLCTGGR